MRVFLDRLIKNLRKADYVTISFQLIIITILIVNYQNIENIVSLVFAHMALLSFLLIVRYHFRSENSVLNFLNIWILYIIIPLNFSQLPHIIPHIYSEDIDSILIQLDFALFGVHPTIWLEKLHYPFFTEFLQLVYITFYFLPVALIYRMQKRNEYSEMFHFQFVFFFGFYLSYIGYLLFPSIGPRFTLQHYQSFPLEGLYLTNYIQNTLNNLEQINRDAFPSGHTMMTVLSLIFAMKYDKKLVKTYFFITVFMIISTVYLRYHYVVDVFGGLIFVAITMMLSKVLYRGKKETFQN